MAELNIPSWFNCVTPQFDILNNKLDESVFAANLGDVMMGMGNEIYLDPKQFFKKTYVTNGLRNIATRVVQALNGGVTENRVISLQTGFGGGKTHALISLYHIVKNGAELNDVLLEANVLAKGLMPTFSNAKIAVFTNNTNDVAQGRTVAEGFVVHTLWGEIAYQLGGVEAYKSIEKNDVDGIAPSKELITPILKSSVPSLILIDELADYCVKAAGKEIGKGSLFTQTNSFIQTLTEAVSSVPQCVLLATLPASATEVASSAIGQEVLDALQKRIVRIGASEKPVADEEIYEVIRRRLFDNLDYEIIDKVAEKYKSMYHNRRTDLPSGCDGMEYANRIKKSYPFHPELIEMFHVRWGSDSRFQRTRGVLRILASIVQDLYKRRNSLVGTHLLIHTSDVCLDNLPTLTGTITNLEGANWETVMHADILGSTSNAFLIDNEDGSGNLGTYSLTQGIAATLLMSSIGSSNRKGLTIKEIKQCLIKPDSFNHNDVNAALNKLEGVAHYLYSTASVGEKVYWFQTKPNVNILVNKAKSNITDNEVMTEIETRLRNANASSPKLKVLVNPSSEIPEQKSLTLVVLSPRYAIPTGSGYGQAEQYIKNIALKKGNSDRIYRNTIFYLATSEAGLAVVKTKLQESLGCKKILDEYKGQLDKDQLTDVMKRSSEYDIEANKALIGAYSVVIRYSARNGFARYDLTSFANDLTVQIRSNMMEELVKENWILKSIGCRTLDVNNLMPAVGKPVKLNDIFEAFLKFDDKPMILGPETVTACANDNCQKGHFNIAQSTDGNVFKNIKHLTTMPFLDPTDENYWIIDESVVEKPVETATGVNGGVVAGNGTSAPFGGTSNDPMNSPAVPSAGQAGTSSAEADKVFQNIEISGSIDGGKWNQMFSSFINLLRRNNLEIDVKIRAKSTADNPIKESSPTYKSIKESASQMGLDLKVEE
jgi:hypothetical protein